MLAAQKYAAVALAIVLYGCGKKSLDVEAALTPEQQFVFEHLRIEEQRKDGARFLGIAERATGDLAHASATNISIDHYRKDQDQRTMLLRAPSGELFFTEEKATFASVEITTSSGGTIKGGVTRYDGAINKVAIDGPISLEMSGLSVTAHSGELDLHTEELELFGPVQGEIANPSTPRSHRP